MERSDASHGDRYGAGRIEPATGDGTGNGQPAGGAAEAVALARGLGWLSLGRGLAQVVAPGEVARLIGLVADAETRTLLRAIGLREIASGLGILTKPEPTEWVWARVGGDAMDLALLGKALNRDDAHKARVAAATAAVVGLTALDLHCATRLTGDGAEPGQAGPDAGIAVKQALTINKPPAAVYRFWRDFENLPRFMLHLESVEVLSETRSRWTAKAPAGRTVSWEAEITEDRPNELIAWRSVADSTVPNAGTVRFDAAPGGRGTEVRVDLHYHPPGGVVGATIAKLTGEEPSFQMREDLRRLKQVLETGDVVRSDATLHGARVRQHPAQPAAR